MKKIINSISPTQIIIEFVSVVFAVLLALGLNSYKQTTDQVTQAQKIKESIIEECKRNLSKIDTVIANNEWYENYLDSVVHLKREEQEGLFVFDYELEITSQGAWEMAQNNPASSQINPRFLEKASDIYQLQEYYTEMSIDMIDQISYTITEFSNLEDADKILATYYRIRILNTFALELKGQYQELIEDSIIE